MTRKEMILQMFLTQYETMTADIDELQRRLIKISESNNNRLSWTYHSDRTLWNASRNGTLDIPDNEDRRKRRIWKAFWKVWKRTEKQGKILKGGNLNGI